MKIFVLGLWHLGCVTAACCAAAGHQVIAYDPDGKRRDTVKRGKAPVFEPDLDDLLAAGLRVGTLRATDDPAEAASVDVVWVACDTPVDDDDIADVEHVLGQVRGLFPHLRDGTVVLVSAQVPVGTTHSLAAEFGRQAGGRSVDFAYSPENLRLGSALRAFTNPVRIVVGTDSARTRRKLEPLFTSFSEILVWVSVLSAEMTKHAVNAFLAMSVTFINEIAVVSERVGADAREIERALRSEPRIGGRAYIRPGAAFAGGTLARDVRFLQSIGDAVGVPVPLMDGILASNHGHKAWPYNHLKMLLGDTLRDRTIALLGLTYKPGTSTLRRSLAIELGMAVAGAGGRVRAYDPAIPEAPVDLPQAIELCCDVRTALRGADAAVLTTEWPEFGTLTPDDLVATMASPRLLDANGILASAFEADSRITYLSVGNPA